MAEPAAKKFKSELSRPALKSGIISASRSAGIEDFEDPIVIPVVDKEKAYFFPAGHDFSQGNIDIDIDIKQWSGEYFSEDSVRDDVYTVLRNHQEAIGIDFPSDSYAGSTGGKCKYSEKELKTIFTKHAKKGKEEFFDRRIQEKEQRLILKLTSKPELCVLRGREIVVGEIKQKSNYDMNWAKRQCSVYCYGVLYYYKVILGIPLDRVFGFWLSGPNCNDLKRDKQYMLWELWKSEVQTPSGKSSRGNNTPKNLTSHRQMVSSFSLTS